MERGSEEGREEKRCSVDLLFNGPINKGNTLGMVPTLQRRNTKEEDHAVHCSMFPANLF